MSTLIVSFPAGKRADAQFKGFTIQTDQSRPGGGEGAAPEPFDLFLASIATCAGVYVKGYCDAREIPTSGLRLEMQVERDESGTASPDWSSTSSCPPGFRRSTATRLSVPRSCAP